MSEATRKVMCDEYGCNWHGLFAEVLLTSNPFDPDDELQGCPQCKQINTLKVACDEPDCWSPATCGTPTDKGYRSTCGKHMPKLGATHG